MCPASSSVSVCSKTQGRPEAIQIMQERNDRMAVRAYLLSQALSNPLRQTTVLSLGGAFSVLHELQLANKHSCHRKVVCVLLI